MLTIFDHFRDLGFVSVLLRVLVSCFCGAVIGLERSAKNRPAGFRTHILICLGATVATLTSLYITLELELPADATRILAQIIAGLGVIGAGTIIITQKKAIKGLTTAAGLWTTGIIGISFGCGYYEMGILGVVLVLLTETQMEKISRQVKPVPQYVMQILYNEKHCLDQLLRYCKDHRMAIVNLKIRSIEGQEPAHYIALIELRGRIASDELVERFGGIRGIASAALAPDQEYFSKGR